MKSNRSRTTLTFALAPLFALAFAWLVSAYWRFFRMGAAGGNGMVLLFLVLPLSLLVFCGVAAGIDAISRRAQLSRAPRGFVMLITFSTVLALMFTMEVRRTAGYPQESGEPVDVRDFFSALVGGVARVTSPMTPPAPRMSFADATFAYVAAGLCVVGVLGASLRFHWLLKRSRPDRVGLRPRDSIYSGPSLIWQRNVLNPRNYRPGTGEAIVRAMRVCFIVQGVAALALFFIAFGFIL